MARFKAQTASITSGGAQFTVSDFSVPVHSTEGGFFKVLEVDLKMGDETKSWQVVKKTAEDLQFIVAQSLVSGVPAANDDTDVIVIGESIELYLAPGDSIQVTTTNATSLMDAKVYLEEV